MLLTAKTLCLCTDCQLDEGKASHSASDISDGLLPSVVLLFSLLFSTTKLVIKTGSFLNGWAFGEGAIDDARSSLRMMQVDKLWMLTGGVLLLLLMPFSSFQVMKIIFGVT